MAALWRSHIDGLVMAVRRGVATPGEIASELCPLLDEAEIERKQEQNRAVKRGVRKQCRSCITKIVTPSVTVCDNRFSPNDRKAVSDLEGCKAWRWNQK